MTDKKHFEVGDIIRRCNGKRTAEVERVNTYDMYIRWHHTGTGFYVGSHEYDGFTKVEEQENIMTLYESKDGKIWTKLVEKSNKAWVMEAKGSGEVGIKDPKDLEEILPYTIEVNVAGKVNHYQADEGVYQVDDMFIMGKTLELARVTKLNTKNKSTRNTFKPFAKLSVDTTF